MITWRVYVLAEGFTILKKFNIVVGFLFNPFTYIFRSLLQTEAKKTNKQIRCLSGWLIHLLYGMSTRKLHLDQHPRASGDRPQVLTLLGGLRFIPRLLRHPFLGECRRGLGIFRAPGRVWGTAMRPVPHKKALCHTRPIVRQISFDQPLGCLASILSSRCWLRRALTGILEPQGAVPLG